MVQIERNIVLKREAEKPIVLDVGYCANKTKKPVVILVHGFKGFKDWGHFNLIMEQLMAENYVVVKFNFSHNGGTVSQPVDFPDLEAFGNNNYSKELKDLKDVVDWVEHHPTIPAAEIDGNQIYMIGHSRGGGIAIVAAHEDKRIKKLVCWAAVSDLINRFDKNQLEAWEKTGVIYVSNSRTKQEMPLYYQMVEDALLNQERLNIRRAAHSLSIPLLVVHGTADEVVDITEGENIHRWNAGSERYVVEGANHTFDAYHPYPKEELPLAAQKVLNRTIQFFKK